MNNLRMTHLLRMPDLMGLTWKRLLLLATAGARAGSHWPWSRAYRPPELARHRLHAPGLVCPAPARRARVRNVLLHGNGDGGGHGAHRRRTDQPG